MIDIASITSFGHCCFLHSHRMLQANLNARMRQQVAACSAGPSGRPACTPCQPQHRQRVLVKAAGSDADAVSRRALLAVPFVIGGLQLAGQARAEEASAPPAPVEVEAPAPVPAAAPVVDVSKGKMEELYDQILAYKFEYPTATASGKPLKMILSHPPEKYSSAAPLTPDARQRIVSELLDLRNFISVSMTVGPASGVLKGVDPSQWKPMDVALTVLIDRSTSRLTSGQRTALNDVEEAHVEERENGRYFVYEHLSQGSPTVLENKSKETFRHALAVTTVRPDTQGVPYLYTLNLACRQEMWDDLRPLFERSIKTFRLTNPTDKYVAPDVNPWQFW